MNRLLAWIRQRTPSSRFTRSVSLVAGGATIGQAINVLVSPILTRLYPAEDFGVLAVYGAIVTILTVTMTLRYELAIPLAEDDESAINVLALSGLIVVFSSVAAVIVVSFHSEFLLDLIGVPGLQEFAWMIPAGLFLSGLFTVLIHWAIRRGTFSLVASTNILQSGTQAVVQLLLGWLKAGTIGLLTGQVGGFLVAVFALAWGNARNSKPAEGSVSLRRISEMSVRYKKFPLVATFSSLLNFAGFQLPNILVAAIYGAKTAGYFALALRVVGLPLRLLGTATSQVFYSEGSAIRDTQSSRLTGMFFSTAKRLAVIGLVMLAPVYFLGAPLFAFVFGEEWFNAGEIAQTLSPLFYVQFIVSPLSFTLTILERQGLQLAWDVLRFSLLIGVFYAAKISGAPSHTAIAYFGVSSGISYILLFLLSAIALKMHEREKS